MRFGKAFIGLFTVLLIVAAVIFGKYEYAWHGTVDLTLELEVQGQTEEILCWEDWDRECFFFLPSYADLSQIRLNTNVSNPVYLDGQEIQEGMTCEDYQINVPYDLCYTSRGKEYHFSLTFLQSANVAAMHIDTASGSMEHIHEKKDNEEPGTMRLYTAEGVPSYVGNLDKMEGRGNSTWIEDEKKPYNLTLSTEGDLLGMGSANRWILLANAKDPSNIKNKLAYQLARDAGLAYSPDCEWVDLYLNGEYAGLYLLCERNEVHPQRVNIAQEGSFLVVKDREWRFREDGDPFIMTEADTALRIYYSDFSQEQLLDIFQRAENAILAEDGIDPVTGKHWQELIDLDSWARRYLVEEVLGNGDASVLSQFFYCNGAEGTGKIYAGPIWDMDQVMSGTYGTWLENLHAFYGNLPNNYGSAWVSTLFGDGLFLDAVKEIYGKTFRPLLTELAEQGIDAYLARTEAAGKMNSIRWEIGEPGEFRDALVHFLEKRLDILNRIWVDEEPYVTVIVNGYGWERTSLILPVGAALPELAEYPPQAGMAPEGWYISGTEIPFERTRPIYEDVEIELRYTQLQPPEEESIAEEPLTLAQLWPALLFAGMLAAVTGVGLVRTRRDAATGRKATRETAREG